MKVEVFKTDVRHTDDARMMIREIQTRLTDCSANFDLDDCDHVLRVVCPSYLAPASIVDVMKAFGFHAEVLPDDMPELLRS